MWLGWELLLPGVEVRSPRPTLAGLGSVPGLRKLVWCVTEATCKLFIACLNYWVNIDPKLGYPRSYLLFPRARLWYISHLCLVWALSAKGWVTQAMYPPEGHNTRSLHADWALLVDISLYGRGERVRWWSQSNFCSYES